MSKSCDVECLKVIQPNVGLGGLGHKTDARCRLFTCPQFFGPATDAVSTCRVAHALYAARISGSTLSQNFVPRGTKFCRPHSLARRSVTETAHSRTGKSTCRVRQRLLRGLPRETKSFTGPADRSKFWTLIRVSIFRLRRGFGATSCGWKISRVPRFSRFASRFCLCVPCVLCGYNSCLAPHAILNSPSSIFTLRAQCTRRESMA
jgi:hypothetical protein